MTGAAFAFVGLELRAVAATVPGDLGEPRLGVSAAVSDDLAATIGSKHAPANNACDNEIPVFGPLSLPADFLPAVARHHRCDRIETLEWMRPVRHEVAGVNAVGGA